MSLRPHCLAALAAILAAAGCSGAPKMPQALADAVPFAKPVSNLAIVADQLVLERDGMPFHQGVMCRAYFFRGNDELPVRAKGDVVFIAYDLTKNGNDPKPVGIYEIKEAELASHYRKDIVGPSYVFWLPYEPAAKARVRVVAQVRSGGVSTAQSKPSDVDLLPLKDHLALASAKKAPSKGGAFEVVSRESRPALAQVTELPAFDGGVRPRAVFAQGMPFVPPRAADANVLPANYMQPSVPRAATVPAASPAAAAPATDASPFYARPSATLSAPANNR